MFSLLLHGTLGCVVDSARLHGDEDFAARLCSALRTGLFIQYTNTCVFHGGLISCVAFQFWSFPIFFGDQFLAIGSVGVSCEAVVSSVTFVFSATQLFVNAVVATASRTCENCLKQDENVVSDTRSVNSQHAPFMNQAKSRCVVPWRATVMQLTYTFRLGPALAAHANRFFHD